MKRYTFKTEKGVYIGRTYPKNEINFGGMQKLGQHEDIEEELGIDLITLFKSLKNGVYYRCGGKIMKRYIRTKDNKIYDTAKERYLVDGDKLVLAHEYETHPTMTNGNVVLSVYITEKHVDYVNCGTIANEADDIFDLIQSGDLIRIEFLTDDYDYHKGTILLDEFQEDMETLVDDMKDNYISLHQLYTKQGDNYMLVWDKQRGII